MARNHPFEERLNAILRKDARWWETTQMWMASEGGGRGASASGGHDPQTSSRVGYTTSGRETGMWSRAHTSTKEGSSCA
jgi:hypothetical protein